MTMAATSSSSSVWDTTLRACGLDNESFVPPARIEADEHGVKGYTQSGELCFAYTPLQGRRNLADDGLETVMGELPLSGVSLGHLRKSGEWMVKVFR
jgi:hypothetical protein